MRRAKVYCKNIEAGTLTEESRNSYVFQYNKDYLQDPDAPSVSITMPRRKAPYKSERLFPFFANMTSEGANKRLQCMMLKIDEDDNFGLLLAGSNMDGIGAVRVKAVS